LDELVLPVGVEVVPAKLPVCDGAPPQAMRDRDKKMIRR
jgi:hypothetical protein